MKYLWVAVVVGGWKQFESIPNITKPTSPSQTIKTALFMKATSNILWMYCRIYLSLLHGCVA